MSPTKSVDNFVKNHATNGRKAARAVVCDTLMTNEAVKNQMKSITCNIKSDDQGRLAQWQASELAVEHSFLQPR
jgi:hypothetical protein